MTALNQARHLLALEHTPEPPDGDRGEGGTVRAPRMSRRRVCLCEHAWADHRRRSAHDKGCKVCPCQGYFSGRTSDRGVPGPQRLASRLRREGECLVYTGSKDSKGYGQIKVGDQHWKTHRYAYALAHGAIPDGLVVMHSCDNPPCCNLEHLSLGTVADNNRDCDEKGRRPYALIAELVRAQKQSITHCPQGHEYTDENTYRFGDGRRRCRTCHLARSAQHYVESQKRGVVA